ncbi:MAG TPA: hypothetical protein VF706_04340 [Solirubrobacteraceae bacterium]
MTRFIAVPLVVLAALLPAAAHASVTIPPDLAALEQQTAALQANSERFSFQEELAFGNGLLGQGIPLVLIVAGAGEASDSPAQATVAGGLFGSSEEQVRVIGETTYRYQPAAAEIDGGRPWVSSRRTATQANGLDPGGLLENDQSGKQGTFSKLVEQLNGALAIEESGPVTVDDQRVVEFDATLDPTPFVAKLESQSKQPKHPLSSPFQIPSVGGPGSSPKPPPPPPTLKLEVFLAPNGLPVRARSTFAAEGATIAVRLDTLAINIPVHVAQPPARQTIDEPALKRIERRHAARELKRALRDCRRLHGKPAARCRALAHLKSGRSQSGQSLL